MLMQAVSSFVRENGAAVTSFLSAIGTLFCRVQTAVSADVCLFVVQEACLCCSKL